ncbi:hypothetical protein LWD75_001673 [Escherichia coli]|nr:hypothetical protein [Escherichia coli]EGO7649894.1 hypothetical protein [Escherichia coli]EGO7814087.1 hypothetical protein [Escherichia coli]EGO9211023.1 hypothetical protein [Escherichia coli]EIQ9635765.1 hypothetical protein [Escherichia coli]
MAYHIEILKIEETDEVAKYEFGPTSSDYNRSDYGEIAIDKRTGEMMLIRMVKNDSGNKFYLRASFKILTCWRKGYLPKNEEWAS